MSQKNVISGAERPELYLPLLIDKRVAFVGNQTSSAKGKHTLDFLLENNINVVKIFGPEHGFREMADDATPIVDKIDTHTGIEVISLYGSIEKPTPQHLEGIEIFIYDIQDVGCRFYTYISTLSYIMEAAAENNIPVIILDRPNPNAHYVDGNILDMEYSTFVGRHPVPIVYGMTVGEYSTMVNQEGWLKHGILCDLKVIPCANYTHNTPYSLPIKPSPNLPNDKAINLYPSTCFFEGTAMSEGRGTDKPFMVFGSPQIEATGFSYVPEPQAGATEPRFKGQVCHGVDLSEYPQRLSKIDLQWLIWSYNQYPDKKKFFIPFFNNLAGGTTLRKQIEAGMSAEEIRDTWGLGLEEFRRVRSKYLIYD